MAEKIYFQGGRAEARQVVRSLIGAMTGAGGAYADLARGVHYALGFAALSDITADFVRKARGGVGEDGVKWPRLSPKTLAYSRRFGKGEQARLKKAAGLGRGNAYAPGGKKGLLTKAQLKRWRQIYGTRLARFAASMPLGAAKARAAKIAWATLKSEGAKTKLEVFGNRPHEVLRDTGVLLGSLSPGQLGGDGSGVNYSPPSGPGGEEQVFRSMSNGIIVGTNVPYAAAHQNGNPKKGIPARPFLPKGEAPEVWRQRWAAAGTRATTAAIRMAFTRGAAQ